MELFDTSLEFLINSAQTMTFYDVAEITKNQHCTGNPVLQPLFMLFFLQECIHPQYPDKSLHLLNTLNGNYISLVQNKDIFHSNQYF